MSATINKLMTTMVGKSAEFQYSDKSVINKKEGENSSSRPENILTKYRVE